MENNVKEKKSADSIFFIFPEIYFGLPDKMAVLKGGSYVALLNREGIV